MNVKKTLASPEERKHQTNERKGVQREWFTSPDDLKVNKMQYLSLVQSFKSSRLVQFLSVAQLRKLHSFEVSLFCVKVMLVELAFDLKDFVRN